MMNLKIKNSHSVLRYGISKVLLGVLLSSVSTTAFASLQDCYKAGEKGQYATAIKECKPYADSDIKALGLVGFGYGSEEHSAESLLYLEKYITYYKSHPVEDNITLALAYTGVGNIYYFGSAEPTYPKDVQKGIEYITKGAELGSAMAQEQLGSFYGSNEVQGLTKNFPMSYYWYELGSLNGGSSYSRKNPSYVHQNLASFEQELPYCIAIGQDMVGKAYYKDIGGLGQSNSEAVVWLQKAYKTDPNLSVTTLDLAKMYYNTGNKTKAFEYAQKAVSQPLAQAYQYLATFYILGTATDKDPVKAAAYMTVAVDLYKTPDVDFWDKFEPTCMPNYKGSTAEFNEKYAQKQLSEIKLTDAQKQEVTETVKHIKEELENAEI
jgi:hypothetical protein